MWDSPVDDACPGSPPRVLLYRMYDVDVIVVGAGAVGLMLANLLGREGLSVILLEKRSERGSMPRAVGVSPPSLEIFQKAGLVEALVERGRRVSRVVVSGPKRGLGTLSFAGVASDYPFVLTCPQDATERTLESGLARYPAVRYLPGRELRSAEQDAAGVTARGVTASGEAFSYTARYLAGCDGARSALREAVGIPFRERPYRHTFLMGDFDETTKLGDDVAIFFTPWGSVESFPLPGGLRRYVLSTPSLIPEGTSDFLATNIPRRAGIYLGNARMRWESAFATRVWVARRFGAGRIWLAGDAAHLMSPIVGQNMNAGFADAECLAAAIRFCLREPDRAPAAFSAYERSRRRSATAAARRAALMMRLGTARGSVLSPARNALVAAALHGPAKAVFEGIFSMTTLPNHRLGSGMFEGAKPSPRRLEP